MALNVFNGFILTLKAVLRKIAQHLQMRKTPAETQLRIPGKNQIIQEQTREGESKTGYAEEPKYTEPDEQIRGEKGTRRPRKPYKKKSVTEGREAVLRRSSKTEKGRSRFRVKAIDLGDARKKSSPTMVRREALDATGNKGIGKPPEEVAIDMESPFIEIDVDEGMVFFILPKQRFKIDTTEGAPQHLSYGLQLNGQQEEIIAEVTNDNPTFALVEEKRIRLEKPLRSFHVTFPDELQRRTYLYSHHNEDFYTFVAIGNNRGRMHYLYDKDRRINPLPKREVWALLHEDYELGIEPIVTEETWIWERYKPYLVNLKGTKELIMRNIRTGAEDGLSCEISFSIEGEQLAEDDFREQSPLLAGTTLEIRAPRESTSGWTVWVQNREAGYRIVSENWAGSEPLSIRLPDALPCECGEFQVDVCHRDTRIADETLFFRWVPFIELQYPRQLIIPRPRHGHSLEIVKAKLVDVQEWELKIESPQRTELTRNGVYVIEVPPEQDVLRFSIAKRGKPETNTNIQMTIPRLKWKTSRQRAWDSKPREMQREDLIYGEDLYLFVRTNDFHRRYDLSAILEANGQRLQEAKSTRKGTQHVVRLNEFYDTVRQNSEASTLKLEIRKAEDSGLLGTPEILRFAPQPVVQPPPRAKPVAYDFINMLSLPRICSVLRRIKARCPKEKRTCKEISQIYYDKIRRKKRTDEASDMHRKDFVIRSLAFVKFIMDIYGDRVPIRRQKGQKKWRARIDSIQQQYPEEFGSAYDSYSRR